MKKTDQDHWILYSTCDEDSTSELRALSIGANDRVISVTGSGCRTLSLLTQNPASVVSVDFSAGQNHLLELKLAAIRSLDYDTLLGFFGVEECNSRWTIFEQVAGRMRGDAVDYFRQHRRAIEEGILFSGRHERFYVKVVAPAVHLLFGRRLKRLFNSATVAEQYALYKKTIDGRLWRGLVRAGFSENTLRFILNDTKYHINIDVPSIGDYILQRLDHTFSHHLARDNHWVSFMFNGRYPSRNILPHFLLRDSYDAIRRATTDITLVTANLIEYLKTLPNQSIDKFSLSDVTSCINQDEFNALLAEVARTARPGAHLCYRNFLARYSVPRDSEIRMRREDAVSSALDRDDLAFVYSFEVATIGATS
jgi:S-adenosylmethionine-diacylglycerol 3-amino-3-carboxypropyl transferase